MHPYRTHTCGELREEHIGMTVRLSGWIHNKRSHGAVEFIVLRDHYGLTQTVVYPGDAIFYDYSHLPKETVVCVNGTVAMRSEENPAMPTGKIEIRVELYEVLGECEKLPFTICPEEQCPVETRLRYRFLDLRRSKLHESIILRSRIISSFRRRMTELGFHEFQTPILTSSSPEGARDYLVPSRVHKGSFYALPQAPQQFKQLLMISGFDRYFQVAPCFRDEDARADRSPGEFYQLDMEMSFVTQDDVFAVVENIIHGVFTEFTDWRVDGYPFTRIPYREAMAKYGSDKPDLRIPIEIRDVSSVFGQSSFAAFRTVVEQGGVVRAIPVAGIAGKPRSFFDKMTEHALSIGAKGLAYLTINQDGCKGSAAKFLTEEQVVALKTSCGVDVGDGIFFIGDMPDAANRFAGDIRVKLGRDLDLIEKNTYRFCWIVDFPMYERDPETGAVVFSHNPFSMPQGGMEALERQDPLSILAYQYDIVCNGIELSSGAIRNHRPDIMYKAFEIAGYTPDVVDRKFGAMINAFRLGAPPHGGIAPGIDRIVMLIAHEENIREVIAFPMNQRAQDVMMNAPSPVSEEQLRDLGIRLID